MRILAVRGKNLASIPRFEIDLSRGPLAETRIFAITGPTGAGKSTLLDAMCLALYDRAPRLFGARDVPVGELGVNAQDPRSVMRRGTAEAHAEVDFLSWDGGRYRAIWEVWRAHKKVEGKLQNQRMRLVALDTGRDISGATKTETQSLIADKIGLTFSEFRRAVLLAQGDFASFLRAKADERAELLERMTGTEIYALISRAAFARAREEEERLRILEAQQAQVVVMDDEARATLREQLDQARTRRRHLDESLARARAAVAWHTEHGRLVEDQARAATALAAARRAFDEAAPLREEVTEVEEAEKLRAPFESLAALSAAEVRAKAHFAESQERYESCRKHKAEAFAQSTGAAARLRDAEQAADDAAPELEQARRIDVQIDAARAHAEEAQASALDKRKNARRQEATLERTLDEIEEAETAHRQLLQWLESHAETKVVAAQWPRWKQELIRFATQTRRAGTEAEREAALADRHRESTKALKALEKDRARILAEREHAELAVARAKKDLEEARQEVKRSELDAALDRLAREQGSLDVMRAIAHDTRRLARLRAEARKVSKQEGKLSRTKQSDADRAREQKVGVEETLAKTSKALAKLEAELDLAARRTELLVEGEPCPLCGSTEHPAKAGHSPEAGRVRRLTEKRARLDEERRRLVEEIAAFEEAASRHGQLAARASERVTELDSELEAKKQDWVSRREAMELVWLDSPLLAQRRIGRIALTLPDVPKARGGMRDIEKATAMMRDHAAELYGLVERDEAAAEALEQARSAQDTKIREIAELEPRFDEARRAASEAVARLEAAARERKAAEEARDEARSALAQPLARRGADWADRLQADPDGVLQALDNEVRAYEESAARAEETRGRLEKLSREADLALAAVERARRDRARADATRAERLAKQTALERRRRVLLSGRTVQAVEEKLHALLEEVKEEARAAESRHNLAKEALAAAEERLEAAREAHQAAELARSTEETRLGALMAASRFEDASRLATALSHEPGWLEENRRLLDRLREEVTRRESTLQDRQARLAEQEARAQPGGSAEEAAGELATLEEALGETVDEVARLAERMTTDERARSSLAELAPAIDAQRRSLERWSEMNALIGSADGKKLRTFAQGLTLDILLVQANLHLGHLRPRYRLERVPGYDMELQVVDGDMGEEVRPVATLSGGEAFLVSLALALGLSSLSSQSVTIESLFIDEGFGHLDRDSLEVALATLDQLQAEGRTIGLISHVPDIAERIGYQVLVEPTGPGRSTVRILGSALESTA